ncbi:uncharacterized protein LACBIDRAFT_333126 [Laccaria bicolor S238N-H82]|uniref:Predicted protein n=1 Tax=Laccaria bicolor (strain S238N-H82 / ATCC MYA-4686) TaxID=486041 RepID=B0DUZ3_LACBS|nr:uncharacterized protein LACBIDRAFT_333126 [Laccaria bicolor S238N-H82]EDR01698.1 predicted protein [Laccaria bicolor S238N-H82]|eukprot:XP_001887774.1 predicted protein [Laccaria bicolor S238N-H82]
MSIVVLRVGKCQRWALSHHVILADVDTLVISSTAKAIIAWETRRKSLDQNQLFIHDPRNAYPAHFSQSPCRKGIEAKKFYGGGTRNTFNSSRENNRPTHNGRILHGSRSRKPCDALRKIQAKLFQIKNHEIVLLKGSDLMSGILPEQDSDTSRWNIPLCGSRTMKNRGRRSISSHIVRNVKDVRYSCTRLPTSGMLRMEELPMRFERDGSGIEGGVGGYHSFSKCIYARPVPQGGVQTRRDGPSTQAQLNDMETHRAITAHGYGLGLVVDFDDVLGSCLALVLCI